MRTIACGRDHTLAVTEAGELWVWGQGAKGQLGLNDGQDRLVPTLLAAEVFQASKIVTVAAGGDHTTTWLWERAERFGRGACYPPASWAWATSTTGGCRRWWGRRRCLGGPRCARLTAGTPHHSAAVTAGGALYTWGQGEAWDTGSQVPGGLGHADIANKFVPTLVPRQLLGGARVDFRV